MRGDFVTLIRVSSQKAVQSQGILPARLIFIMLLAEAPCINPVRYIEDITRWREDMNFIFE